MGYSNKKMKKNSLISVIITTKDRRILLERALNSVLNQTYRNIEIIIVNDASKDETKKFLESIQKKDLRIRVINNEKNLGSNPSRNLAINIAKGKFIAGLDDDDEFLPNRLELLIKNYDKKYSFITSNNRLIFDNSYIDTNMPDIVTLKMMTFSNVVMNQGLIKLSRIKKVGKYDEKLTACQDYDLWMRLVIKYGNIKVLREVTQKVFSEESRLRISSKSKNKFSAYFRFYKTYKYLMNNKAKKYHLYRLYDIRNKNLSLKTILTIAQNKEKIENLDYFIRNKVYKEFISNIITWEQSKERKYILYGYGTIGKIILPILKDSLLAIIDSTLENNNIKEINNIPIIKKESLIEFKDCSIIITPIIHYEKIKAELKEFNLEITSLYNLEGKI